MAHSHRCPEQRDPFGCERREAVEDESHSYSPLDPSCARSRANRSASSPLSFTSRLHAAWLRDSFSHSSAIGSLARSCSARPAAPGLTHEHRAPDRAADGVRERVEPLVPVEIRGRHRREDRAALVNHGGESPGECLLGCDEPLAVCVRQPVERTQRRAVEALQEAHRGERRWTSAVEDERPATSPPAGQRQVFGGSREVFAASAQRSTSGVEVVVREIVAAIAEQGREHCLGVANEERAQQVARHELGRWGDPRSTRLGPGRRMEPRDRVGDRRLLCEAKGRQPCGQEERLPGSRARQDRPDRAAPRGPAAADRGAGTRWPACRLR